MSESTVPRENECAVPAENEGIPLDRDSPKTAGQILPSHYASGDIPHVLARIRAFDRFFAAHVDRKHPDVYLELHGAAMEMLEKDLDPYALELALSLMRLEDELDDPGA